MLVPVDWHDLVGLSVELADTDSLSLTVDGPAAAGVPIGDGNLTVRAAHALRTLANRPLAMRVWLSKIVPHGAGLGGGSADAAAVLRAGVAWLASLGVPTDPRPWWRRRSASAVTSQPCSRCPRNAFAAAATASTRSPLRR